MLLECFRFIFSKYLREMLLCRKPEVILDFFFAHRIVCILASFLLFCFVFSTRRTTYEYERIVKLDLSDVNDLWFRLKELILLN